MPTVKVVNPLYEDGVHRARGDVFDMPQSTYERLIDLKDDLGGPRHIVDFAADEAVADEVDDGSWKLNMTPADYLKRFPTGPNAALAQAYVDADAGDFLPGSEDEDADEDE